MFYTTNEMSAIFSRESHVRHILRFEAALASAEARAGIIPNDSADAIVQACETAEVDVQQLYSDAIPAGTLAIPVLKMLTEHAGPEAGAHVHWGATSQDAIDTAFMLQIRSALDVIAQRVLNLANLCKALAETHRGTPMVGRTLHQQAIPITFGLKAARWLAMLVRQLRSMREVRSRTLVIQFGGAVGTLASIGSDGVRVQKLLAEHLDLGVPDLPWHTERDRIVEIVSAVGLIAGCAHRIAGDLALMVQSEVGEVAEHAGPGKGGSSTMPHKRNPVDIVGAIAAARLATSTTGTFFIGMHQEHERASGGWQAEWESLPNLFQYTDYALERLTSALEGLEVDSERMRENLDLTRGLIMAESLTMKLAVKIGRTEAYRLVQAACHRSIADDTALINTCLEDREMRAVMSEEEIVEALKPETYLGSTDAFIDNALALFTDLQRGPSRDPR